MTSKTNDAKGSFAETLGEYIEKSGYTVQKLAQITGLGRSAIQHTLSGKLVPAKAFVDRLCAALPMTPDQRTALSEMYVREKAGEAAYYNRSCIRKIIESLPQYCTDCEIKTVTVQDQAEYDDKLKPVTGVVNIGSLMRSLLLRELAKENPVIRTTIPFEYMGFFSMAQQMLAASPNKALFEHFFVVTACPEGAKNPNMDILQNVLKIAVYAAPDYKPYYHYTEAAATDHFMLPYPYFIITSDHCVLLSEDFCSAMVTTNKSLHNMLREHADHMRERSQLMIEDLESNSDISAYMDFAPYYGSSIEYQPFLIPHITQDILNISLADLPEKGRIVSEAEDRFYSDKKQSSMPRYKNYFSEKGLIDFTQTGIMKNIPGQLLDLMDKPDRICFLESMKKHSGCYTMLDDGLHIPPFMQIICLTNRNVLISCLPGEKRFVCKVTEPGLCSAFEDYISSLSDSGLTQSSSIMSAVIDKCIEMLR